MFPTHLTIVEVLLNVLDNDPFRVELVVHPLDENPGGGAKQSSINQLLYCDLTQAGPGIGIGTGRNLFICLVIHNTSTVYFSVKNSVAEPVEPKLFEI